MNYNRVCEYAEEKYYEIKKWFDFLTCPQKRLLFGTGQQAVNCLFLLELTEQKIDGFVVSNKDDDYFRGYKVYSINDLVNDREDVIVFFAVGNTLAQQKNEQIREMGIETIPPLADWEKGNDIIKEAVFIDYCIENGISIEKEFFVINNHRFLNPLHHERAYRQMFMGTSLVYLVKPALMQDESSLYRDVYKRVESINSYYSCVLDIGSNIGLFSRYISKMASIIYAIEPSKTAWSYLKKNTSDLPNIQQRCLAISDYIGWGTFYDNTNYPKYSSLSYQEGFDIYSIEVNTIDAFVYKNRINPDLIRIDVGDDVWKALEGAKKTIMKYRPSLLLYGVDINEINDFLTSISEYEVVATDELLFVKFD